MLDPALMELKGARAETKYTSLATVKFIAGLQTQRSPYAPVDTRYNSRFLGGKPDALIAGSNVEISNSLTLQRRFGLSALGPSIPPPLFFYEYKQSAPPSNQIMIDTATAVYNYSSASAGLLFYKSPGAGQTNFWTVVNTLFMGNGVDLLKYVGPNLLVKSNTFSDPVWTRFGVNIPTSVVGGFFDPNGGTSASQITWQSGGGGISQIVTPNLMPVSLNTFTFSVWLRQSGTSIPVQLIIGDQGNNVIASVTVTPTATWTRFQVTGTMLASSTSVIPQIFHSGAATTTQLYAAQLEVGGPAQPTQITTTQPQGLYNWGIVAPTTAPAVAATILRPAYQTSHAYVAGNQITDSNGNIETVTTGSTTGSAAPTWPQLQGSSTTDSGGVVWRQDGPSGLSPKVSYQWYYAFLDAQTGQPSNVSPISASTSLFANNLGAAYTITGNGSLDPQVNKIAIYRNTDGGGFWLQVATIANPANGGTWSFVDTVQDTALSSIFAPVGLLNTPPPAGALDPQWHQSRLWVHQGSTLFYGTGPDNAQLLNITQNGNSTESFAPLNNIPLDQPIIRKISSTSGLLVWTVADLWLITGTDLTSFNPIRIMPGHGIRSYNAVDVDGSTFWFYTADRQMLSLSASAGSIEVGFAIGDLLTGNVDPTKAYVARHNGGSLDSALFLADGSTGWFRLNPNQIGASVSGEPTPVWSPFATIVGGLQAIASIETSPGIHQLLAGSPGSGGSVLTLGSLTTSGVNSGSGTSWTNPNNVTLNDPNNVATVTLNAQSTPGGTDVSNTNNSSSTPGTAVDAGGVTTTGNNELAIMALFGLGTAAATATAGSGFTLDVQINQIYTGPDYFIFETQHESVATAGAITTTATLSASYYWTADVAVFKSGNGTAPTIVQQKSSSNTSSTQNLFSITATPGSAVTQGNYLVVCVGGVSGPFSFVVTDSLGNQFSPVVTNPHNVIGSTAIFLAPITTGGVDTITLSSGGQGAYALAMNVYEITLPFSVGSLSSKNLQATSFGLNVPNNNILGVKVYVTGNQTSNAPDANLTLSWISPPASAPSYVFQLPATTGTVSFGGIGSTWGQSLTSTLLNSSSFGFQLQANVVTSSCTFNVQAVQVQVFYLNGTVQTFTVSFRDLTTFQDNGNSFTWSATIGSIMLAPSGQLAETESITTDTRAANGVQPGVAVLLDEIAGSFESLPTSVNDPPQLGTSTSILSNRFQLNQGATPPLCKHLQIQLSGGATNTKDELLALVIRGALVPEQV